MTERKEEVLRSFVLNAPPGQLDEVLKSLHVVTDDDALCSRVLPSLALEHHIRHHTFVVYEPAASMQARLVLAKENHVATLLGALTTLGVFEDAATAVDCLQQFALQKISQSPSDALEAVFTLFVDTTQKRFVFLEPLQGTVVRHCPLPCRREGEGCPRHFVSRTEFFGAIHFHFQHCAGIVRDEELHNWSSERIPRRLHTS